MKNFIKYILVLVSISVLLSCDSNQQNTFSVAVAGENSDENSGENSGETPARESQMKASARKQICHNDRECKTQCESLFMEWENKQKCFLKDTLLVKSMYQLMTKILKKPSEESLTDIDLEVLHSVLSVSEKAWLMKINKYSKKSSRSVLFWLADQAGKQVFSYRSSEKPARLLLTALLRQNARTLLLDDNAVLSGLKEPIEEKNHFFEVANRKRNIPLLSLVHRQIVAGQMCNYSINYPKPSPLFYVDDDYFFVAREMGESACVLAVYCHLTGSYSTGQYIANKKGQALRKDLAGELKEHTKEITDFIQASPRNGGLGVKDDPDDWTDSACVQLKALWDDANLKFNL